MAQLPKRHFTDDPNSCGTKLRRLVMLATFVTLLPNTASAQDITINIDESVLEPKEDRKTQRYYNSVDTAARNRSSRGVKKEQRKRNRLAKKIRQYTKKWPERLTRLTETTPFQIMKAGLPKGEIAIQRNNQLSGKDGHIPGVFLSDFIVRVRQTSCDISLLEKLGTKLIKSKVGAFAPIKKGNHGYLIAETWRSAQLCGIQCLDHANKKSVAVYLCEENRNGSKAPLAIAPDASFYPGYEPTAAVVNAPAKPGSKESEQADPEPAGTYCHERDDSSCYSSRSECEDAGGYKPGATKGSDYCNLK